MKRIDNMTVEAGSKYSLIFPNFTKSATTRQNKIIDQICVVKIFLRNSSVLESEKQPFQNKRFSGSFCNYTKNVLTSEWQKSSLTTLLSSTFPSIAVLIKDRNHYTGRRSSEFVVYVILSMHQCWVDSIATFCSTLISLRKKIPKKIEKIYHFEKVTVTITFF